MNLITPANEVRDALEEAWSLARELPAGMGIVGYGIAHLLDGDGHTKQLVPFANLITTAGDQYYAQKGIVGVSPANASAPTAASGMKLGTGSTAAAKSSTGASIVTYISGSNVVFDSSFPAAAAVAGTDTGWNATYKTTWAAGTATNSAIVEVAIVNDQSNNSNGSSAANTYSRAVITSVNKTSSDSLAVTWNHKFLGA
jgi:hypothetical protein